MGDGRDAPDPTAFRDFVEGLEDLVVGVSLEGILTYVNPAITRVLGWDREELIGESVLDYAHPDDLGRGFESLLARTDDARYVPLTVSRLRIRHADGSWVAIEFLASDVQGSVLGDLVSIGRYSPDQDIREEILTQLKADRPPHEIIGLLLRYGRWRLPEGRFAVRFLDEQGSQVIVGDDLEPVLVGAAPHEPNSPFAQAAQTRRTAMAHTSALPEYLRRSAETSRLSGVCVRSVTVAPGEEPAFIVAWSPEGGSDPTAFQYTVALIAGDLDLVLRWRRRDHQLERATKHDLVTGAYDRTEFLRVLDTSVNSEASSALLVIHVGGLKDVNTRHGSSAGDEVLLEAARRIGADIEGSDVLGRVGNAEFALLCRGADEEEATAVSKRLLKAFAPPIMTSHGPVTVDVAAGGACTTDRPGPWLLQEAKRALGQTGPDRRWVVLPTTPTD